MKIIVVGSGLCGAYAAEKLSKLGHDVHVLDVSRKDCLTSDDVSFNYEQTGELNYNGIKKGRFFGPGGTTNKWGGQLVFLDDHKDVFGELKKFRLIVDSHRNKVLEFFNIDSKVLGGKQTYIKNAIWLNRKKRSVLKYMDLSAMDLTKATVDRVSETPEGLDVYDTENNVYKCDRVYICAGAFESIKILYNSNLTGSSNKFMFRDHLSYKIGRLKSLKNIRFYDEDFEPYFRGDSLITKRLKWEEKGFISLNYNSNVETFKLLKKILYNISGEIRLIKLINEIGFIIQLIYKYVFLSKLHLHHLTDVTFDIENIGQVDFERQTLNWSINNGLDFDVNRVKKYLSFLADKNGMEFSSGDAELSKPVDSYHPCAFRGNNGFQVPISGKVSHKIFCFSTAQLPEAAWANPTVNVLCLFEEHLVNER